MSEDVLGDAGGTVPTSSPLAALRKRIDQARDEATIDFPVPIDEGMTIVFRFRAFGFEEIERAGDQARRAKNSKSGSFNKQGASLLAWANQGVFVEGDNGTLESIDPESDCHIDPDSDRIVGEPVTISSNRMAELLGLDQASAWDAFRTLLPKELLIPRMLNAVTDFSTGEDGLSSQLGN